MKDEKELQTPTPEEAGIFDSAHEVYESVTEPVAGGFVDSIARAQIELLQQSVNELGTYITDLERALEHMVSVTAPPTALISGLSFRTQELPKQDVFNGGINYVGRPGVAVIANDGSREYTVAKLEWDHIRNTFVLYTGKGVN